MEYLLICIFFVFVSAVIVINIIKMRERNMEKDYKHHCHIPPTAMKVKYLKGIPEIDKEIERRYAHIIKSAYTQFDEGKYKDYVENLERKNSEETKEAIDKIKNKINDFRFTKNLDSVDNNMLIYIFEKVGIIDFYFWIAEDKFYLADKHHQGIGCFSFELERITCFCKKEDLEKEDLRTSNMKAAGTGLEDNTLTFNKSTLPQYIKVDGQTTVLELVIDNNPYCGFFTKEAYEVLVNQIPQKQLTFIRSKNEDENVSEPIKESIEVKENEEELARKVSMLEELMRDHILTKDEYEEKKKILLEKVKK